MRKSLASVAMVVAMALACVLPKAALAQIVSENTGLRLTAQATTTIHKAANGQGIQCLNEQGQLRIHVNGYNYTDSSGTKYRCVHPSKDFEDGTFTQEDISRYHSSATVHKCALAQYWCEENVGGATGDSLAQIFIWKTIIASGETSGIRSADFVLDNYDSQGAWARFNTWYAANKDKYDGKGTYWSHGDAQPVCRFWAQKRVGTLQIEKSSANKSVTENSSCYSLEGAKYTVYKDRACTQSTGKSLTCDSAGKSGEAELEANTYYVRETVAPKGYLLDETPHEVEVTRGGEITLKFTDEPITDPAAAIVQKLDKDGNR